MAKGWTWIVNSPKWHYITEDTNPRTLCGRWIVFGVRDEDLQDDNHNSVDNCKACRKKLIKLLPGAAATNN